MKKILTNIKKEFDNRTRLGIMSILMVNEWVEFKTLKEMLELSDGNLASHLKTLESKDYIEIKKEFVGKKPQTTYKSTDLGKKAFNDHLNALEELIRQSK